MQVLSPTVPERARVVFFVPLWLPRDCSPCGMPWRALPVLSALAEHGFRVTFFNEEQDGCDGPEIERALSACDGVIAWSVELSPGAQIPGLLSFLRLTEQVGPACTLVGGGFFTLFSEERLKVEHANLVIRDFGPDGVVEPLEQLLGLAPHEGPPAGRTFSPLALRALDLEPYVRAEPVLFGNTDRALQLPTGFGCAKHCGFCMWEQTKVRLMMAADMVDLIVECKERYQLRQFLFGELDFFTSIPRAMDVAQGLCDRRADIRWFTLVSLQDVMRMTDEQLDMIARSGCHILEVGTEAGSLGGLRRIGKPFGPDDAIVETRRLLDRGIIPLHNIIVGAVGETREERRATLKLVRKLRALDERVTFSFRTYQPVPTTTMGEEALKTMPPLPETLGAILEYRLETGRSMPWLTRRDELEATALADHYLPLGYDDVLQAGRPSLLRRALRVAARARTRTGVFGWPVDRRLFDRFETVGLKDTFIS